MDLSVGIKRAITILSGMGYNHKQIDDMIDSVITDQQDPSVIVKLALSSLNDDEQFAVGAAAKAVFVVAVGVAVVFAVAVADCFAVVFAVVFAVGAAVVVAVGVAVGVAVEGQIQ